MKWDLISAFIVSEMRQNFHLISKFTRQGKWEEVMTELCVAGTEKEFYSHLPVLSSEYCSLAEAWEGRPFILQLSEGTQCDVQGYPMPYLTCCQALSQCWFCSSAWIFLGKGTLWTYYAAISYWCPPLITRKFFFTHSATLQQRTINIFLLWRLPACARLCPRVSVTLGPGFNKKQTLGDTLITGTV